MEMNLKHRIASGALALSLMAGTGASVAAQNTNQGQQGGAAGLVAAVVQLDDTVNVEVVDSLNNLRALNNLLNNSPILSNNDIDVNVEDISVLDQAEINALVNVLSLSGLILDDVVGVVVFDNGSILAIV